MGNCGGSAVKNCFPETVLLEERYSRTCSNDRLKQEMSFVVNRIKYKSIDPDSDTDWEFTATLEGEKLSELQARNGGQCDTVLTSEGSEGCGLATTLMSYCFDDDKVGGLDPQKDEIFKQSSLKRWRDMAKKNCEHLVHVGCLPLGATKKISCSAYLTAALNTRHTMMFSHQPAKMSMAVMEVGKVQPEFKKNADDWIKKNGHSWYFCRCNEEKLADCESMK